MIGRLILAIAVCIGLSGAVHAQDQDDEAGLDAAQAFLDSRQKVEPPKLDLIEHLDEDGQAALTDALREYFRYFETGYIHRRDVFQWQLLSSKVIFFVVIFLVLVGVYFAWLQFMLAYRAAQNDAAARDTEDAPVKPSGEGEGDAKPGGGRFAGLRTSIDFGKDGVKVNSSVLGVVILVISLAFFYLYLEHIYPIEELF